MPKALALFQRSLALSLLAECCTALSQKGWVLSPLHCPLRLHDLVMKHRIKPHLLPTTLLLHTVGDTYLLLYMGVQLGQFHWGKNKDWGSLRIICWGRYLDLRGSSKQDGEKLHVEELHDLCHSPNIIQMINSRRTRWAGHVAHTGEKGKPEGKTTLVKPRCAW